MLELTGTFACITQQEIDRERVFSASGFTVSDSGVIVFQSTLDSATRLIWFDPSGKELGPVSQDRTAIPVFRRTDDSSPSPRMTLTMENTRFGCTTWSGASVSV